MQGTLIARIVRYSLAIEMILRDAKQLLKLSLRYARARLSGAPGKFAIKVNNQLQINLTAR